MEGVCVDPWVIQNRLQCVKLCLVKSRALSVVIVTSCRNCPDDKKLTMAFPFGIVDFLDGGRIGGRVHRRSFGSLFCSPVPVNRAYSLQYSSKKVFALSLTRDRSRSRCFLLHPSGLISIVKSIFIFMRFSG